MKTSDDSDDIYIAHHGQLFDDMDGQVAPGDEEASTEWDKGADFFPQNLVSHHGQVGQEESESAHVGRGESENGLSPPSPPHHPHLLAWIKEVL